MKIKKLKTLNEAIEEIIDDGTYSVMDHNLASSVKREAESKEKAIELFDDKTKESALEDRDAHSKVSTSALKKMHLSESLFEEYEEKSLNESLYDDILKEFPELKGKEARLKAVLDGTGKQIASAINGKNLFDQLGDLFPELNDTDPIATPSNAQNQSNAAKYTSSPKLTPEEYADLKAKGKLNSQKLAKLFPELNLSESINGNTSHAQDFVSALRSAGFGDGFDQKLKIDTYGNGGTRVEYKDQGGTFTVTITDDKVVLEGQDEGEDPFKKEFSTWEEFASEFESLYPGIPVGENKILVEENSLEEASYTRSDNKKMLVKPNRDPLVDVIQLTLTDGEWGYVKSPNGTVTPSLLPHLSYNPDEVGVSFDNEGRYFVRVWDVSEESLQKVAEIAKQFNREYKIGFDKYAAGSRKWYCLIYLNEDTDFDDPYVDPEAEVNKEGIKGRGTKLRGNPEARHARDNEDLEDSQRYPIESPAPA